MGVVQSTVRQSLRMVLLSDVVLTHMYAHLRLCRGPTCQWVGEGG